MRAVAHPPCPTDRLRPQKCHANLKSILSFVFQLSANFCWVQLPLSALHLGKVPERSKGADSRCCTHFGGNTNRLRVVFCYAIACVGSNPTLVTFFFCLPPRATHARALHTTITHPRQSFRTHCAFQTKPRVNVGALDRMTASLLPRKRCLLTPMRCNADPPRLIVALGTPSIARISLGVWVSRFASPRCLAVLQIGRKPD